VAQIYTVKEFDCFTANQNASGYTVLPENIFDNLEKFILANNSSNDDAPELMGISVKKGVGKVITAQNYVGIISMKDGTTIEILPKVYEKNSTDGQASKQKSKTLLLKMLRTLNNVPYKSVQRASLDTDKLSIFEIFIRMFTDEVFSIVKYGLKCNYRTKKDNLNVYKGKLDVSNHIRYNAVHKERFFVEFDEYNADRAENRIIKTTLQYLYKRTTSTKNKNDIRTLLNSFADIQESTDYKKDFEQCVKERGTKTYSVALMWAEVFLKGKSFTAFAGSNVAIALLFPMEKLFESYVASLMRKSDFADKYQFSFQDKRYHLFETPKKIFRLKPDIVALRRSDNNVYIMDTKWKILKPNKANYGISQADMYQMYAYYKKYSFSGTVKNITLIYPETSDFNENQKFEFKSGDGVTVYAKFINLYDENAIEKIFSQID